MRTTKWKNIHSMIFRKISAIVLVFAITLSVIPYKPVHAVSATSIRVVVNGTVKTGKAIKKTGDWYMKVSDIKKLTGIRSKGKGSSYVSLSDVANKANVGYEYDPTFNGAYFWTDEKYGSDDYIRAYDLGLVKNSVHKKRNKTITGTQFRNMLITMIKKTNSSKVGYFKKYVKPYNKPIRLGEATGMAFYAARCIGADRGNYEFDLEKNLNKKKGAMDAFWDDRPFQFKKIMPKFYTGKMKLDDDTWPNARIASYLWMVWHCSDYSRAPMVEYDSKKYSFHFDRKLSYMQAVTILTRLYDSRKQTIKDTFASLGSEKATTPDSGFLTSKILKKAAKKKNLTINDLPPTSGFVFGHSYEDTELYATPRDIKMISDLGFNSCRILVSYQTFFDQDVTKVNVTKLKQLDELIAAGIRYNVHVNFAFISLPGRWTYTDYDTYETTASLDMFTDESLLKQTQEVWRVIAARYKDVPSAYLSFLPFWEAMNKSLSSNRPYTDYTWLDVERSLIAIVDTIRRVSPDRAIVYEPNADNEISTIKENGAENIYMDMTEKYDNILISSNFCEMPYVYQEMTASETDHIDHANHGMFKQEYPVSYPHAYSYITESTPITLDGFLPSGTSINIYLKNAVSGSTLTIVADGGILAEKTYDNSQSFNLISGPISSYMMYSDSEEKVNVTLGQKVGEVKITSAGEIEWSGIEVIYPNSYAVSKVYFPSDFDRIYYGETHEEPYERKTSIIQISPTYEGSTAPTQLTLSKDMTYTSDQIAYKSDKTTVNAFFDEYHQMFSKSLIRFECADFNTGTTVPSKVSYYTDILSTMKSYDYSWLSALDYKQSIKDCRYGNKCLKGDYKEYKGYKIERKVIKTLQKYQHSKRW